MAELVAQRLINPEVCIACFSCSETCSRGAIVIRQGRVAVDFASCDDCGACVTTCPTGAIGAHRLATWDRPHAVEAQLTWQSLPGDEIAG